MRHPGVRWTTASLAVVCTLVSAVSILGIWIYLFDNDGGEPGAATIFGSVPFWPLVPLIAITAAVASYRSLRIFLIIAAVATVLLTAAVITIMLSRAENARKQQMHVEGTKYIYTIADAVPDLR